MATYLLDTHAFLFWLTGDKRLPPRCRRLVAAATNEIVVSAASVWEIATKARIGKLKHAGVVAADVPGHVVAQGFRAMPISMNHAQTAGSLPEPHRDPFDRMLIAQSQLERIPIISADEIFDRYGVNRVW